MHPSEILDTGFTVVHPHPDPEDPNPSTPLLDIVFIHGLQGHPYRTWTYTPPPSKGKPTPSGSSPAAPGSITERSIRRKLLDLLKHPKKTDRGKGRAELPVPENDREMYDQDSVGKDAKSVFWPADLLPESCPRARILVWGYDTQVAKLPGQAVSKSNVFSEGKNLLFALRRERDLDVPIMFVAHSLGGIILKEALAISYDSGETDLENVAKSTRAVIFMGTPHRGSKDMADIGEAARRVASAFFIDTNNSMLDALGLKTQDLDRCEDSFSKVWRKIDFKIKTFQEGLSYKGVDLWRLNEKVVPDQSSRVGDPRERAETLQANHMEMCRFRGKQDPNYRKVGPELKIMYNSIVKMLSEPISEPQPQPERYTQSVCEIEDKYFHRICEDVRLRLFFPELGQRHQAIEAALKDTCQRLLRSEKYEKWYNRQDLEKYQGLLWIKGKPGSGKSTLMKEAVRRSRECRIPQNQHIVSFFINARGSDLEHSTIGLFRALMYQLLPLFEERMREFVELYSSKTMDDNNPAWDLQELKNEIRAMFAVPCGTKIFIFVDALDECSGNGPREIMHFFRELCDDAFSAGAELSVCLSSRHYPNITIAGALELVVEVYNDSDIALFVDRKVSMTIHEASSHDWKEIKSAIIERASGIFLWARLVLDLLFTDYDDGKSTQSLRTRLCDVPQELENLYTQLVQDIRKDERDLAARFFSWVLLPVRPVQVREWYELLAVIGDRPPQSLVMLRLSGQMIDTQDQLQRCIRRISRGLVEIQKPERSLEDDVIDDDVLSIQASLGSLHLNSEGSGRLEFIHESVREFFLGSGGFKHLLPHAPGNSIGSAHLLIVTTCFDYLAIEELDELVNGRKNASRSDISRAPHSASDPGLWDLSTSASPKWPFQRRDSLESMQSGRSGSSNVGSSASNYGRRSFHSQGSHVGPWSPPKQYLDQPSASASALQKALQSDPNILTGPLWKHTKRFWKSASRTPSDLSKKVSSSTSPVSFQGYTRHLDETTSSYENNFGMSIASVTQSTHSRGWVLEQIPDLFYRAIDMVAPHAMAAEASVCDPSVLVSRLQNGSLWTRWVLFRDDMKSDTSLLYFAAEQGLLSWVSFLLANGTDINVLGGYLKYPLIAAANTRNEEVLNLLLHNGADFTVQDGQGRTFLHHLVIFADHSLLAGVLDRHGGPGTTLPMNEPDRKGQTPFHEAAKWAERQTLEELQKHGSNPNVLDKRGNSALHFASGRDDQNLEILGYLVHQGLAPLQSNHDGSTPIEIAADNEFYISTEFLLRDFPESQGCD